MTSVPRTEAISPSDRPLHGDPGSPTSIRVKSSNTPRDRSATRSAPSRRRARASGSATAARRVAASLPTTSSQPGSPGSMVEARIRMRSGSVRAMTWAPCAAARSEARSCCSKISSEAKLPRRFQLSGRSAARDISAISCMRASGIGPTVGMNSSVVPGWRRSAPASATNSSKAAEREGTGRPSPSVWPSPREEENPSAPSASDVSTSCDHGGQLLGVRLGPGGVVTHDGAAHSGMADQESGIHRQAPVDPGQVLAERRPVPLP